MSAANARRTLVKICGLREPAHGIAAVEAGADLVGLVFYPPSHRYVSIEEARAVVAAIRDADPVGRVRIVGLFVNTPVDEMERIAEAVGLDLFQLSGDEAPEAVAQLSRPALLTLRVDSSGRTDEQRLLERLRAAGPNLLGVLVDAHVPGMYGGTGTLADWFVAADLARQTPVFLAGGLDPENIGVAMRSVRPFGVDVSSGVETGKQKDVAKIRAFIHAARAADAQDDDATPLNAMLSDHATNANAHKDVEGKAHHDE